MMNRTRQVAILVLEGFIPFDFSIPYTMFGSARHVDGGNLYTVRCCGLKETVQSGTLSVKIDMPLSELTAADVVMIPGLLAAHEYKNEKIFGILRKAADAGARVASICTGAWVLAASGLLDGLTATTHWEEAEAMAEAFPSITIEPDVLFLDNGRILTSAGLASGMDLCLHIIRQDYGAEAAERCANFFVLPYERSGGYPQCVKRALPAVEDNFTALQLWLLDNIHRSLSLREIASHGCMSLRTLNRKFKENTGGSPMEWLTKARVRRAQRLLESTRLSIEEITEIVGFGSPVSMRACFRRYVGSSPAAWRKTYGNRDAYLQETFGKPEADWS